MRVLVIVVIVVIVVVVIVIWESKANSSSSLTELQTGTELGNNDKMLTFLQNPPNLYTSYTTFHFEKNNCINIVVHLIYIFIKMKLARACRVPAVGVRAVNCWQ